MPPAELVSRNDGSDPGEQEVATPAPPSNPNDGGGQGAPSAKLGSIMPARPADPAFTKKSRRFIVCSIGMLVGVTHGFCSNQYPSLGAKSAKIPFPRVPYFDLADQSFEL